MLKFVFALTVAVALMHQTQAFKVVTINKSIAPVPAIDTTALLQSFQSSVTAKLQQVQTLVNSIVQQKIAFKQSALNSVQSTMGTVKTQVSSYAGGLKPSYVIRKNIYIGAAPEATTTVVDYTTKTG